MNASPLPQPSCRPSQLDQLLAGELPPAEADALRAHLQRCAACAHELAWQRQERALFAQRVAAAAAAAGTPAAPVAARRWERGGAARTAGSGGSPGGLRWEALEARLRQAPARVRASWAHRGTMAAGAMAAVFVAAFSVMLGVQPLPEGGSWGGELVSRAPSAEASACIDPGPDSVARHEARFGACLLASPLLSLR